MIQKDSVYREDIRLSAKNHSDSEGDIVDNLREKLKIYKHDSVLHKRHELFMKKVYYILGYSSFVFSIVISVFSGSLSINEADDNKILLSLFILSVISNILQGTINFFKIKEKEQKYAFCSASYSDMQKKLEVYLLHHHDKDEYSDMVDSLLSQEMLMDEIKIDFINTCFVSRG